MKKLEFFFKNILLNILLFFNSHDDKGGIVPGKDFEKILFIRLNRIGDALVVTPLLHEIKKKLNSKIYLLADKNNFVAFNNNTDVDEILVFDKDIKGFLKVLKFIKTENIKTVVDLHVDISTTVSFLIALCKAKNKFALEKSNKKIYTKTVKTLDGSKYHIVDRILEISKLFEIEPDKNNINIHFTPAESSVQKVQEYLNKKFPLKKILIGINISAGSTARFWGIENYKKLINYFIQFDVNLIIICSPTDVNLAKEICNNKYYYFSSENYDEFASMISGLDFLFTPDTAAVHLASVFEIPVFGLYVKYNTEDMIWSPYKSKFDCVVTTEPNLKNMTFESVKIKLQLFIENFNFSFINDSR